MATEKTVKQSLSVTPQRSAKKSAPAARPAVVSPALIQRALADPAAASPADVLALQCAYGNQVVQRLLAKPRLVQRDAVGLAGGEVAPDLQGQIEQARGGGQALDAKVGSQVGQALGADFSGVRVHTDSQSDTLNHSLSAKAFTLGSDIFFSQGAYNPSSSSGKGLLAHELIHVMQQGGGKVNKVQTKLTVGPASDRYEQEADRVAEQVMAMRATRLGPAVQRQAEEESVGDGAAQSDWPGNCQEASEPDRPAASFVRLSSAGVIQRAPVAVSGGEFDTFEYLASDSDEGKGADIALKFDPDNSIGADGDTISLVQTVKDTTRRYDNLGTDVTIAPETSQLGNRTLRGDEPGVEDDDVGTGIDQEVLSGKDRRGLRGIQNLDPRYTEQRMSGAPALNTRGKTPMDPRSVRSAKKGQREPGKWTHAALNDAPNVSMLIGPRRNRQMATITGGMEFEVAALHNEENKFLGSVKWGWKMDNNHAVLDPAALTLVNAGSASRRFFKAAAKWNRTDIVDPRGGPSMSTMKLPIPSLESARERVEAALAAYPKSSYEVTPRQRRTVTDLLGTLRDIWNGLSDDARGDAAKVIIGVLDNYLMTVQGRRPSQDVMWSELEFKHPPRKPEQGQGK